MSWPATWPGSWTITTIITHRRPHLDEAAAIIAVRRHGRHQYPGADNAPLEYFDPSRHQVDGKKEEDWLKEGVLFIGVGGYRYDDHPHAAHRNECAFTLVTDDLGLRDDLRWRELRRYILTEDREGAPHPLHLALLVKNMHGAACSLDMVLGVVEATLFDGFLPCQEAYGEALRYINDHGQKYIVTNKDTGKPLVLVVVNHTDNEHVSKAARSEDGMNADMVVHRNCAGSVYISTSQRNGITWIGWLAARLRHAEQQKQRPNSPELWLDLQRDFQELSKDGMLLDWYHQKEVAALMNGSPTATHVPPTRLELPRIVELAQQSLAGCKLRPAAAPRRKR